MASARRPSFLERADLSLLLFGGKGGVGKTTCATATALYLAKQFPARNFLLVSIDPAHSVNDCLNGVACLGNLHHREIDFRECLQQFKSQHAAQLRQIALRGTFLDKADIDQMLDLSIPGFDELMAFIEIAKLLKSKAYSCIIVDTAPTGHTLRFLNLPELMQRWLGTLDAMLAKHRYLASLYAGQYRHDQMDAFLEDLTQSSEELSSLLRDSRRCLFIPVMLAEPICTSETSRLVVRLKEEQFTVVDIVVNRLIPPAADCPVCRNARRGQEQELRTAMQTFAPYSLWGIPLHGGEVSGNEQLGRFWEDASPVQVAVEMPARMESQCLSVERPAALPGSESRLLLFAGKGGVGKTTLACASAIRFAQEYPGKQILLFSTDPAHSLSDCLATTIGSRECRLGPGLTATEIDAEIEFEKLRTAYAAEVEMFFGSMLNESQIDMEFDRETMHRLLDLSPPGLDEVMALLRAVELLEAKAYDILVLDTAPTGHLVRLLEMPELIQSWVKAFFDLFLKYQNVLRLPRITEFMIGISRKIKHLRSMLADPRKGQLSVVSILTEMAFEETKDLFAACRRTGAHVATLFLNLATPVSACELCRQIAQTESRIHSQFRETFGDVEQTVVYRWEAPEGMERLAQLGQALYRA